MLKAISHEKAERHIDVCGGAEADARLEREGAAEPIRTARPARFSAVEARAASALREHYCQ